MKTVELGSVATIERKGVAPGALAPDTLYLGLEHIERGGRIIGHDTVGGAELASTKFQFTPEHVLFGKLRPNLGKISRPGFAGVCSTDILPIRPGKDLDRNYLAHYLAQPSMVDFAASRTSGANLPRLSPTVLATFPVRLPPLPEQRRIAAILDHADALRAKRRQVLTHLDSLTQSIFHDMFGGDSHPFVALGEVASVKGGKRLPKGAAYADCPTPHPYIRVTDLRRGVIRTDNLCFLTREVQGKIARYTVDEGDVIISIAGSIGLTAAVPSVLAGANLTENAAKIVAKEPSRPYSGSWLTRVLQTRSLQDQITGKIGQVTIGKLALFRIEQLQIPLPPLVLQEEFVERTVKVDSLRAAVQRSAVADDELFSSLQTRAFRGEL